MDLTRLTHYLVIRGVQNVIDEPIGFDGLKTTIKRGDYHGVSAEVSAGTLEFYDSTQHNAATIIRNAYNEDIETEITYYVTDETHTIIYKGVIDLSTYAETKGNSTKIACKVGEVGVKTMFNVRTETEVDLNATQTIDGKALSFDPTWLNLNVPRKHLRYTNLFRQTYTQTITKDDKNNELRLIGGSRSKQYFVALPITKVVSKEFGETSVGNAIVYTYSNVFHYDDNPLKYIYQTGDVEKFNAEFGVGARCKMTCNIKMHVEIIDPIFNDVEGNVTISCGVGFGNAGKMFESQNYYDGQYNSLLSSVGKNIKFGQGETKTIDIEYENKIGLEMWADNINLWGLVFVLEIRANLQNDARIKVTIDRGTEFKMVLTDELEEDNVFVDMLPVHESLNKIAGIISENQLSVRSDWFGRPDSQVESANDFGGGSLKALTNGYKIRDLYTDEENKRSMQVSFKKAIQALNVLDCVGWGFSLEDGQIVVRVERWDWFYKDDVVLVINDPNEVKRRISTDNIFNEIVIGYKKHKTSSEYNSIDSVFGERVFTSALKSVANKKTLTCEFVADNYAIEETRRARNEKNETEETSYDESIFVFELACVADWHNEESAIEGIPPTIIGYEVTNNVVSASGVARAGEQLNVQLSPRRCAERWRNFLFATNNQLPYKFTSGKINCDASFKCKQYDYPNPQSMFIVKHFLEDFANEQSMSEKKIVEFVKTKFKSEIVEFTYPITISQFNALRDNPYGIIIVNGEKCWLKEVTLKISTGECQFKVIPMNE